MARLCKVLSAQYKNMLDEPYNHLLVVPDESDIRIWYFLVYGLDDAFKGGEYIFKLTAPDDFPQKPPRFEFCTPNGVFEPGGPICISVGEFHATDMHGAYGWRASLGMKGFAIQVVNGLICFDALGGGIRIVQSPIATKRKLAVESRHFNEQHYTALYRQFQTLRAPAAVPAAVPAPAAPAAPLTWEDVLELID
jgi:ubiquitin-protein ligase